MLEEDEDGWEGGKRCAMLTPHSSTTYCFELQHLRIIQLQPFVFDFGLFKQKFELLPIFKDCVIQLQYIRISPEAGPYIE